MRRRRPALPAVTFALAAATGVLALASAAVEPYLAAAGNAATVTELERAGPLDAGLRIDASGRFAPEAAREISATIDAGLPGSASTQLSVRAAPVTASHAHGDDRIRLVAATGALDELELLGATSGIEGLVVPATLADETGLSSGDAIEIVRGDARMPARIAGVYRDLDPDLAPPGLRSFAEQAAPIAGREQRPLDLVFGAPDTVLELTSGVGADVDVTWRHPAPADLTSSLDASALRTRMLRVASAAETEDATLGSLIAAGARTAPDTHVGLSALVRDANQAVAALSGPTRGVGVAGQGVALAVVAAAALFAARARSIELRLATVRGRGPWRQGGRALARALQPMLLGAGTGWFAALLLVRLAGPPGALPSSTVLAAARDVAVALVPASLTVVGVTAGIVARTVRVGRRRGWARLAHAPWELVAAALAVAALVQLRGGGGVALEAGSPRLSPLVLAFPVLVLLAAVGLGVRAARRGLPALRRIRGRARGRAGQARYLAVRRLAAASTSGLALAAACALALGLVIYTATLSRALGTAVEEKSVLQLGAEAVGAGGGLDATAVEGGTEVLRARGRLAPTDDLVDVLLVDVDRFAEVAYWDPALGGGRDLTELLRGLADDERLVVLAAGLDVEPAVVDVPGFRVPVTVAEQLDVLPGRATTRPLLLASRQAAVDLLPADGTSSILPAGRWTSEVWTTGDDAAERLVAAGATTVRTSAEAAARPRLVAVTWSLGALQALAVLATGLALVGVLLFVGSRQRDTQLSYALARRMGLRPSTHRQALSGEVLVLLVVALAAAALVGVLAAALVASGIDPLPDLEPAPRASWPMSAIGVLSLTLLGGGLIGAALLQRGADRANVAEVLRRG